MEVTGGASTTPNERNLERKSTSEYVLSPPHVISLASSYIYTYICFRLFGYRCDKLMVMPY